MPRPGRRHFTPQSEKRGPVCFLRRLLVCGAELTAPSPVLRHLHSSVPVGTTRRNH